MGETITITRSTALSTDAFGNPTYTTSTVTVDDVLVGWVSQGTNSEASRTPSDATITLYLTSALVTYPNDLFTVRGSDWLFDGQQDWTNPYGGVAGTVIHLRQRRG
jgi:hypothetical protein